MPIPLAEQVHQKWQRSRSEVWYFAVSELPHDTSKSSQHSRGTSRVDGKLLLAWVGAVPTILKNLAIKKEQAAHFIFT